MTTNGDEAEKVGSIVAQVWSVWEGHWSMDLQNRPMSGEIKLTRWKVEINDIKWRKGKLYQVKNGRDLEIENGQLEPHHA
jgi:hypothetical protein